MKSAISAAAAAWLRHDLAAHETALESCQIWHEVLAQLSRWAHQVFHDYHVDERISMSQDLMPDLIANVLLRMRSCCAVRLSITHVSEGVIHIDAEAVMSV